MRSHIDTTAIPFKNFISIIINISVTILFFSGATYLVRKYLLKTYNMFSLDKMVNIMKIIFYGILAVITLFLNFTSMEFVIPETITVTQLLIFLLSAFESIDNVITLLSKPISKD